MVRVCSRGHVHVHVYVGDRWMEYTAHPSPLILCRLHPPEYMKLRLLNGTHSALSYVAHLSCFQFVDDALNHGPINDFVVCYMDEVCHRYDRHSQPAALSIHVKCLLASLFLVNECTHRTLAAASSINLGDVPPCISPPLPSPHHRHTRHRNSRTACRPCPGWTWRCTRSPSSAASPTPTSRTR